MVISSQSMGLPRMKQIHSLSTFSAVSVLKPHGHAAELTFYRVFRYSLKTRCPAMAGELQKVGMKPLRSRRSCTEGKRDCVHLLSWCIFHSSSHFLSVSLFHIWRASLRVMMFPSLTRVSPLLSISCRWPQHSTYFPLRSSQAPDLSTMPRARGYSAASMLADSPVISRCSR